MDKVNTKVFLSVAETGSFNETAKLLGYSQAGVSYIINAMEEEMGLRLFSREYGGVRLTGDGALLLPVMRQLNSSERQLEAKVSDLKGLLSGHLRVIVFDSVSVHWVPSILREFKQDFPGIEVELISEEDARSAEEMVYRQEVDCGFFLHFPFKLELYCLPLLEESLQAIVSLDHPLAGMPCFPLAALGEYPYISMAYEDNNGISDIFRSHGVTPKVAYRMDNDYAAMAMVSNGLGFCIFPELLLQNSSYPLKRLDFEEPQSRIVSIATRSLKSCSLATRKFIEYTDRFARKYKDGLERI